MTTLATCAHCEIGTLTPVAGPRTYGTAQGQPFIVEGIESGQCDRCGEHTLNPAQIRANEARVRATRSALGLPVRA